ncbi:Uncharacterized protein CTA2_12091 [Colletotrichum tanaceti]|uniref:Hydantoin racemase n=1 Tax=Colletotrichum tanaceti TaxID=1306861 RepID=A0A4U6X010_9PEZI|nr:Uncharacterized protein CTA2_12091 [Colletotrichum tanaceti]TKW48708.1 uncharacterized protein CTA1_8999 [Colletotrichum tanaceti]
MAPAGRPTRLLCIVPISTTRMTADLRRAYGSSSPSSSPGLEISFLDGRGLADCPPCIENAAQAEQSTRAMLPRVVAHVAAREPPDGVLVCCFSDHPLVHALRELFSAGADTDTGTGTGTGTVGFGLGVVPFVTGIFHAALREATKTGGRFGIVTTSRAWGPPLTASVADLGFGAASAGVAPTGLGPLELESLERRVVVDRIVACARPLVDDGATSIVLGCAGMTALEEDILRALPPGVRTVDGVRAGIDLVCLATRRRSRRRGDEDGHVGDESGSTITDQRCEDEERMRHPKHRGTRDTASSSSADRTTLLPTCLVYDC